MLVKRLLKLGFILAIAFGTSGCVGKVEPGYAGIQVNSWGTARGAQDLPITTGGYTYNPFTTTVYDYPTFVQTAVWTKSATEGHLQSLTPTLLDWRRLEIQASATARWNGALPVYSIGGGGASPLIALPPLK